LVINILCVTFVTSLTVPDPQSSDVRHTLYDVSIPSGISLPWRAVNSFRCRFM